MSRVTLVTCAKCKRQYEVYTRVDVRNYKCIECILADMRKDKSEVSDDGSKQGSTTEGA